MCRPEKVHHYVCGHYVLDKPTDGCALSTISTHGMEPPELAMDGTPRRDPCKALLYELIAVGDFSTCFYEGITIRMIIYRSPSGCQGPKLSLRPAWNAGMPEENTQIASSEVSPPPSLSNWVPKPELAVGNGKPA